MNCPGCGGQTSKVLESRIADAGDAMRRRRECLDCSERFTTYERIEQRPLWVAKRGGGQEQFCAAKLLRGLEIACSKRDVPVAELEGLVHRVERQLREVGQRTRSGSREVTSDQIGSVALAELARVDEAAALRFATVIEGAETLAGFRRVLDRMERSMAEERGTDAALHAADVLELHGGDRAPGGDAAAPRQAATGARTAIAVV